MQVTVVIGMAFMMAMMPSRQLDLRMADRHLMDLKELRLQTGQEKKIEAIEKILSFSYLKSKELPKHALAIKHLKPKEVQELEELARRYPSLTDPEYSQARKMVPRAQINPVSITAGGNKMPPLDQLRKIFWLYSFLAVPSTILAFLLRGPLLFYVAGIAVQQENGDRAGRFRCFLRTAIGWMPLILFGWFVMPRFLVRHMTEMNASAILTIVLVMEMILLGLLIWTVMDAILHHERGWNDRIAGTFLVPR